MALDPNPRRFRLTVEMVDVNLLDNETRDKRLGGEDHDFVEICFAGKIYPSTRRRIEQALMECSFITTERRLA